jgi:hypothetical protein
MKTKHIFNLTLSALIISVFSIHAHSFPIATPGTEGLKVLVSGNGPVIATYQGNSASYSNDLYLMLDALGKPGDDLNLANDLFIFNNHTSAIGAQVNLGMFELNTELEFRLYVNNTGTNFYSGSAGRNPDGVAHARVEYGWQPNETLVSFEDLNGGPFDYNDLSFSFTNTDNVIHNVPEPSILGLLGFGIFSFASFKRQKNPG